MDWVATDAARAVTAGVTGALAGVPIAAIAYSTPMRGRIQLPVRWWTGGSAQRTPVVVTATVTGTTATMIGAVLPLTYALPSFWLVAVGGIGLAAIDVRSRRLPHPLTGTLWVSCVVCFAATAVINADAWPLVRAISAGAATTAVLLIIALAMPGQLGLGDVALAGTITFSLGWLSWQSAAFGLLAGLLLQTAVAIVATLRRSDDRATPMGPALIAGWLLAVVLAAP